MKKITLTYLLLTTLLCFSQNVKKETVYLLLDLKSNEKCIFEDGSGNSSYVNKYRKEVQGNYIYFKICNEIFSTHKLKGLKDSSSIKALDNLNIVNLKYINEKKSKSILKYNPFEKIYIVEKISDTKVVKYEVIWIDDWVMVDD